MNYVIAMYKEVDKSKEQLFIENVWIRTVLSSSKQHLAHLFDGTKNIITFPKQSCNLALFIIEYSWKTVRKIDNLEMILFGILFCKILELSYDSYSVLSNWSSFIWPYFATVELWGQTDEFYFHCNIFFWVTLAISR